eukprot:scaffold3455_cov213-Prasinococcus_capsulatus_cf.AAC.7
MRDVTDWNAEPGMQSIAYKRHGLDVFWNLTTVERTQLKPIAKVHAVIDKSNQMNAAPAPTGSAFPDPGRRFTAEHQGEIVSAHPAWKRGYPDLVYLAQRMPGVYREFNPGSICETRVRPTWMQSAAPVGILRMFCGEGCLPFHALMQTSLQQPCPIPHGRDRPRGRRFPATILEQVRPQCISSALKLSNDDASLNFRTGIEYTRQERFLWPNFCTACFGVTHSAHMHRTLASIEP